jgi:pimeloyl-ACP methyl ester carboxylesterase
MMVAWAPHTEKPREIRVGPEASLCVILWSDRLSGEEPKLTPLVPGTVILLHGVGDSADIWRPVLRHWPLPSGHPFLAFDLPGHGQSHPMPQGAYREDLIAQRIALALKALGIIRPVLIGHSRGARLALRLLQQGIQPSHVILIDMGIIDHHRHDAAIAVHIQRWVRLRRQSESALQGSQRDARIWAGLRRSPASSRARTLERMLSRPPTSPPPAAWEQLDEAVRLNPRECWVSWNR